MNIKKHLYDQCVQLLEDEVKKAIRSCMDNKTKITNLAREQKYLKQKRKAAYEALKEIKGLNK